jgi:uncharacterized RDD family membrane protein YckC
MHEPIAETVSLPLSSQPVVPVTPGAISLRVTGFWRRFFALIIDTVIILVAIYLIDTGDSTLPFAPIDAGVADRAGSAAFWAWLLETLVGVGYFVMLNARGATLGKRLLGRRVVDTSGAAPGISRAARRYIIPALGHLVALAAVIAMAAGYSGGNFDQLLAAGAIILVVSFAVNLFIIYDGLSMLWHPDRQTLHDRMGGTFVVRANGS